MHNENPKKHYIHYTKGANECNRLLPKEKWVCVWKLWITTLVCKVRWIWIIIGLDDGMWPYRRPAIIQTNDDVPLIRSYTKIVNTNSVEIPMFSLKMLLKAPVVHFWTSRNTCTAYLLHVSRSYLTAVPAALLWWHLSNMNLIHGSFTKIEMFLRGKNERSFCSPHSRSPQDILERGHVRNTYIIQFR